MKGILKYAKPLYLYMLVTLLFKFIAAMMDLLIPSVLAKIIDDIVPLGDVRQIFLWGGIMVGCAIVSVTINVTANRMAEVSAGKMTRQIRHDLFAKTTYLSAAQMDEITISSAVSRLTSDTYNLNRMLARMQRLGVRGPILLIGGIIITMSMEPKLTMVLVAALPFIIAIVALVTTKSVPIYSSQQSVLDRMVRVLQENITGVRVIRALSRTEYEKNRFDKVNDELADVEQKAGSISALSNPSTTLVLNLGLTGVILTGAYLVNKGEAGSGAIIAFLSYFTIILNAMLGITRIFVMCSKGIASAKRITEVMEAPEQMAVLSAKDEAKEADGGENEQNGSMEHRQEQVHMERRKAEKYHIEFDHVFFSYQHKEKDLTDISFALKRGENLGIIGPTGSGKSTVINLLLRFYDTDEGSIRIDGKDICRIPGKKLREKFGIVFQNDYLMAASIQENIDFFRGLSGEQIDKAAECAQATDFIKEKQGDMQADVSIRGNNLSGGQKQRIMIARALAANPEILILDDASSALDYQTDAGLRKALHTHFKDTTRITVAQRISSIQGADHILVLDEGKCVGYGTHTELLETCKQYRLIHELQLGTDGEVSA